MARYVFLLVVGFDFHIVRYTYLFSVWLWYMVCLFSLCVPHCVYHSSTMYFGGWQNWRLEETICAYFLYFYILLYINEMHSAYIVTSYTYVLDVAFCLNDISVRVRLVSFQKDLSPDASHSNSTLWHSNTRSTPLKLIYIISSIYKPKIKCF